MPSLLTLAFLASLVVGGTAASSLPFPLPICASTKTLSLSGGYTVTATDIVTSASATTTVTGAPSVLIDIVTITSFTPTVIDCLVTATTLSPYVLPSLPLVKREDAVTITAPSLSCPPAPTVTIVPPSVSGLPCTEVTGPFSIITDTETITTTGIATSTVTPTIISTVTETWVLPIPSSYNGVNYYQYLNDYFYPVGDQGCGSCGYGGGGYETSDWNGNYSYYTNGTTKQINFESEDYPSYSTILCQLPGQAEASDCSQWTVVFQGYLHATQNGNYTIAPVLSEDNAIFFWGGEKAYSSYKNNNTDGSVTYTQPSTLPHSYSYSMVAGEFMPITFIYANGYRPALNSLTITSQNGTSYPTDLDFFVPPCPNSPFVP